MQLRLPHHWCEGAWDPEAIHFNVPCELAKLWLNGLERITVR